MPRIRDGSSRRRADLPRAAAAPHPGAVIRRAVLEPLGLTPHALAKGLCVDPTRINDLVRGRRGMTADTALRLERFLAGVSPARLRLSAGDWLQLQLAYELHRETRDAAAERRRRRIVPL